MTSVVDVILDSFFETMNSMRSEVEFFEAKLIRACFQVICKNQFQSMFKEFAKCRGNGDTAVVGRVALIALSIFYDWNDMTKSELSWYK